MSLTLPELPYAHDALGPYMSKETLEYHHDKHHQAYVTNGNNLLKGTEWEGKSVEEIVKGSFGKNPGVFNNVGQHYNHLHFWKWMKPAGGGDKIPGALKAKIDDYFGRCRLAAFDPRAMGALNRDEKDFAAVASKDLQLNASEVADIREMNDWLDDPPADLKKTLPEVETLLENGYKEMALTNLWAVLAPAGTPAAVIRLQHDTIVKVINLPDTMARMAAEGAYPVGNTPEQFAEEMRLEVVKWAKLIRDNNIRAD